jgi:hypothetical protein
VRIRPLVLGTRWNGCLPGVLVGNLVVFGPLISLAAGATGAVSSLLSDRCHSRLGVKILPGYPGEDESGRAVKSPALCSPPWGSLEGTQPQMIS